MAFMDMGEELHVPWGFDGSTVSYYIYNVYGIGNDKRDAGMLSYTKRACACGRQVVVTRNAYAKGRAGNAFQRIAEDVV